jgi:hypothetical protein
MSQYAGLSLQEIYVMKCEEFECKKNSKIFNILPTKPNIFDTLNAVDISSNFLGPKGIRPLLEVIRCCTNLKYLDLRDQQMTKEVVDELCAVLSHHPTVIRVNLSDNPLTIAAGAVLVDLAKNNIVIEQIILENTQIRPVMCNAIASQLAKNKLAKSAAQQAVTEATEFLMSINEGRAQGMPKKTVDSNIIRSALSSYPFSISGILFDDNPSGALLQLCHQLDGYFQDTQFQPDDLSLQRVASADYQVSQWSRITEIAGSAAVLFPEDSNFQFPRECPPSFSWVFASLKAAVEPAFIRSLITPQQINPSGVYTVKVFVDGAWRFVVVDDFLPLKKDGSFAFTAPAEGKYYWPCIIEKAIAKLHSGYQALDQDVQVRHPIERKTSCATTMTDFCGGVGISRDLHHEEFNADDWWRTLLDLYTSRAKLIGTSLNDDGVTLSHGIVPRHSYEITQVKQVNGFRLLQLQSSWVERTWNGEWASKSVLWEQHPDVAEALDIKNLIGNAFWMPYTKFLQVFSSVHLCRSFPGVNSKVIDGEWGAQFCGGPYFDPTWVHNPRYKLDMAGAGAVFINLGLPDSRFTDSDVETLAFHVLKSDTYPIRFDKDAVVAKTSYVITTSVSFDGTFSEGSYWLVPSTYVPGRAGKFIIRMFSLAPFVIRHENIKGHWSESSHSSYIESSGEYQSGEDNMQYALEFPGNLVTDGSGESGKVLIKLHTPETDQLSLALFLVDSSDRARLLGPIPEDKVIARSKFLISNTVYLEAYIPANASRYTIVTCLNPEHSQAKFTVTVWSSIHKFNVVPLPFWKKKTVACSWESSGAYQETARNPQVELITAQPNQIFAVKMEVMDCVDPSIVFFVVGNRDRVGEGLRGKIPDERVVARSTYLRYGSVVKDFTIGAVPLNSYLIVPCLQPPGSKGRCTITVSCISDDFTVRLLQDGS